MNEYVLGAISVGAIMILLSMLHERVCYDRTRDGDFVTLTRKDGILSKSVGFLIESVQMCLIIYGLGFVGYELIQFFKGF